MYQMKTKIVNIINEMTEYLDAGQLRMLQEVLLTNLSENAQKLEEYKHAPEGSLATIVTSKNIYAKQFINMILGKVHMCSHYSELKKYSVSITKECMKYQNHVASAIKPVIYETPYIGRNAIKVQLEQAICREKELEKLLKEQKEREEQLDFVIDSLATDKETDIRYRIDVILDIRSVTEEIKKCEAKIATLEKKLQYASKTASVKCAGRYHKGT